MLARTAPTAAITIPFGFTKNPLQFVLSIKLLGLINWRAAAKALAFDEFFALFCCAVKSLLRQIGPRRTAI
jgi:hypothetical protein